MKKLIFIFALSISCSHAPLNIAPQAVVAFHGTQLIRALDQIRDTMHAAHNTVPPLVSAQIDLKVVNWHQQAISVVHATPRGWVNTVVVGLDQLQKDLSPEDWLVIAPYVSLAKVILSEVIQ